MHTHCCSIYDGISVLHDDKDDDGHHQKVTLEQTTKMIDCHRSRIHGEDENMFYADFDDLKGHLVAAGKIR